MPPLPKNLLDFWKPKPQDGRDAKKYANTYGKWTKPVAPSNDHPNGIPSYFTGPKTRKLASIASRRTRPFDAVILPPKPFLARTKRYKKDPYPKKKFKGGLRPF